MDHYWKLIEAARVGNVAGVQRIVEKEGVDPNTVDRLRTFTPLHLACGENGSLATAEYLVNGAKMNVDVVDGFRNRHFTPLHDACLNGHLDICKLLVEVGQANIEARDFSRRTPLHLACQASSLEVVRYLVQDRGANVKAQSNTGETPLMTACKHAGSTLHVIRYLVNEAPVDSSMLQVAWSRCFPWEIKLLLFEHYHPKGGGMDRNESRWRTYRYPLQSVFSSPLPSYRAFKECIRHLATPYAVRIMDDQGRLPLHVLLTSALDCHRLKPTIAVRLLNLEPRAATVKDPTTGTYPFEAAAAVAHTHETMRQNEGEGGDGEDEQDDVVSLRLSFPSAIPLDDDDEWNKLEEESSTWLDVVYSLLRYDPAGLLRTCGEVGEAR